MHDGSSARRPNAPEVNRHVAPPSFLGRKDTPAGENAEGEARDREGNTGSWLWFTHRRGTDGFYGSGG